LSPLLGDIDINICCLCREGFGWMEQSRDDIEKGFLLFCSEVLVVNRKSCKLGLRLMQIGRISVFRDDLES
jgi:hypothetical protein